MPPRKKPASSKASPSRRKVTKDIRAAAKDIPAMIAQAQHAPEPYTGAVRQKYAILWACVIGVTLVIALMWYWNAQVVFASLEQNATETTLLRQASDHVAEAMQRASADDGAMRAAAEARQAARTARTIEDVLRGRMNEETAPTSTDTTSL